MKVDSVCGANDLLNRLITLMSTIKGNCEICKISCERLYVDDAQGVIENMSAYENP